MGPSLTLSQTVAAAPPTCGDEPRASPAPALTPALTPSRRQALIGLVGAALALTVLPPCAARAATDPSGAELATLRAYVDVLLPADDLTPAASALGVADAILDLAQGQELLGRLIAIVCDWLDASGAGAFATLSATDRETIVDYMAKADPDVLEGRFYRLIRLLAIDLYYARPEALAGLALAPSPQPLGYPPPWE